MLYLAIGRRELGKTTLVYSLASKLPARVILDPRRMVESPGAVVVAESHGIPDAFDQLHNGTAKEIIIQPRREVQPCFIRLCDEVQQWIETDKTRQLAVVLDEMRFVETNNVPAFDFMLRGAPRETVHVFLTCHRPTDVTVDVRAIMDQWLLFRCVQDRDLDAIEERTGREIANAVKRLAPYEWIQWDDGHGVARMHVNPTAWYVPLRHAAAPGETVNPFAGMPTTDPMNKGRLFG